MGEVCAGYAIRQVFEGDVTNIAEMSVMIEVSNTYRSHISIPAAAHFDGDRCESKSTAAIGNSTLCDFGASPPYVCRLLLSKAGFVC